MRIMYIMLNRVWIIRQGSVLLSKTMSFHKSVPNPCVAYFGCPCRIADTRIAS